MPWSPRWPARSCSLVLALALGVAFGLVGCASLEGDGDDAAERGDWDSAAALYERAYAEDPEPELQAKLTRARESAVRAHVATAEAHVEAERFAEAIASYERALAYRPGDAGFERRLAVLRVEKGRSDARRFVRDGRSYEQADSPSLALGSYRQAAAADPTNADARAAIARLEPVLERAEAERRAGDAALAARDWRGASARFARALEIWPDHAAARDGRVTAESWIAYGEMLDDARARRARGDLDGAWASLQKAVDHQYTDALKAEIAEVGGLLYPGALAAAAAKAEAARAAPARSLAQEALYREAGLLYGQALRYKATEEARAARAAVAEALGASLVARGERALGALDTRGALAALEGAIGLDHAPAGEALRRARYQDAIWEGLESEAAGDAAKADLAHKRAWGVRETAETEAAIARIDEPDSRPARPAEVVLDERAGRAPSAARREADLWQRRVIEALRGPRPDPLWVTGREVRALEPGAGFDVVERAPRGRAATGGAVREEPAAEERVVIAIDPLPGPGGRGPGGAAPFALEPGEPASAHRAAAATADAPPAPLAGPGEGFVLKLDVRYEHVRAWRRLEGARVEAAGALDAAEWQAQHGTHVVEAVGDGDGFTLSLWRACRAPDEHARMLALVRPLLGSHAAHAAPIARLGAIAAAEGLAIAGPWSVDGVADLDADAGAGLQASFDGWREAVRRRGLTRPVRARLRLVGAWGGGLPAGAERLTESVRRRAAAREASEWVAAAKRWAGEVIDTEAALAREAAAAGLAGAAARLSGVVEVEGALSMPVDLDDPGLPPAFHLTAMGARTGAAVEVLLVAERDARGLAPGGGPVPPHLVAGLRRAARAGYDTRASGPGRQQVGKVRLARGRYQLVFIHHGPGAARVEYESELAP